MDGWQPVEELTRWGFAQAPVVMANEAHSVQPRSSAVDISVRMSGCVRYPTGTAGMSRIGPSVLSGCHGSASMASRRTPAS